MWVGKPVAPRRCFFFWFRAPARPALVFTSFIRPTLCRVESIAEQRTAHRWLRPEVRDDAVVTRPSCLHRHGIRSSGARERPPPHTPSSAHELPAEFHATKIRDSCGSTRLTPPHPFRFRPAGLLRELVHVGEDRGRPRQARAGALDADIPHRPPPIPPLANSIGPKSNNADPRP